MNKYGKASNELFTEFVARVAQELPTATIAMFSKMKYVNAPNFEKFREAWNAKYLGGFVVHSKAFDGLKGNFPIGFLVWKTDNLRTRVANLLKVGNPKATSFTEIELDVLDKDAKPIGEKSFYNLPSRTFLNVWVNRPRANKVEAIPLKNAVTPATASIRLSNWADDAIGFFWCKASDVQNVNQTVIFSSPYSQGDGMFITKENLWQAAIVFTVRRVIKPTWLNDKDQFLQPTQPLSNEFKTDCLIWMLFNGSNLTASANNLEWNGKQWSIVNHFIPFTEEEVGSPERFESDFMVRYSLPNPSKKGAYRSEDQSEDDIELKATIFKEASLLGRLVGLEGKKLWQAYFAYTDVHTVRNELKLNRADVGWYQIRKALQARNVSGDYAIINFKPFEEAYKAFTEKLQPQVYELGFLRV